MKEREWDKMKIINSKDNSTYKYLVKVKQGKASDDICLIYGDDLIDEARRAKRLKTLIVYDENDIDGDEECILLKESLFNSLCTYKSVPKRIALALLEYSLPQNGDLIYLDCVQDPGNVGTIIRTALALSYAGVVCSKDSASLNSSKVIQASKGAIFNIPIIKKSIEELDLTKYRVIGTSLEGKDIREFKVPQQDFILIFGSEGKGIQKKVLNMCDDLVLLPIRGIDSLNVAVAASIFMYEFRRW